MPDSVTAVAEAALKLSAEDREALVEQLIASLEPAGALHPEWADEVTRRVQLADAGLDDAMAADEALAALDAHIQARCRPA